MVAMNSMPQQEVAKGRGQMELLLARPDHLVQSSGEHPGAEYPSGGSTLLYIGLFVSDYSNSLCTWRYFLLFILPNSVRPSYRYNKTQTTKRTGTTTSLETHPIPIP